MKNPLKVPNISKGKTALAFDHPFFGSLLMRHSTVESDAVEAIETDGKNVTYNPKWLDGLSVEEATGVLGTVAGKIGFLSALRMSKRDKKIWDMATSYAINPIIKGAGLKLPGDALDDPAFHGLSQEQIYEKLKQESQDGGGSTLQFKDGTSAGNGSKKRKQQSWGGVTPHPDSGSQSGQDRAEAEARIAILQAAQTAKSKGKLPAEFQGLIKDFQEPKIDWKDRLRTFVNGNTPTDYSYRRPNKKQMVLNSIYTPTIEYRGAGHIVIGVDSSGSVGEAEMSQFLAEIKAIHGETSPEKITVIWCDAQIQHVDEYETYDDFNDLIRHGRGGTQLSPVFRYIKDNDIYPDSFIFLTDLEVYLEEFKDIEIDYPCLWVSTSQTTLPLGKNGLPLGEVVKIDVRE